MFKCCYLKNTRQLGLCNMFTYLYNVPGISICRAMFENLHVLNFALNHIPSKPKNERIFFSFSSVSSDSIQNDVTLFSKVNREVREMAQSLRAFSALAEDLGSVPAPTWLCPTIHNSSPRASGLLRHQAST